MKRRDVITHCSSDAGLLLPRQAERKVGICRRLAEAMPSLPRPITGPASDVGAGGVADFRHWLRVQGRNDLNRLRHDPLLKIAVGCCPESGRPLASQSTISRLENAPRKVEAARMTAALVDQFCCSVNPEKEEILDIDETFCAAHGGHQIAFWNAHKNDLSLTILHRSRRPALEPHRHVCHGGVLEAGRVDTPVALKNDGQGVLHRSDFFR